MGSAISSSEKLADNEFLKRFVGLEPITDNDPFWNQLLSFNFKPPKQRVDAKYFEEITTDLLESLRYNSQTTGNFAAFVRVFLRRANELKTSLQCQDKIFLWQTANALIIMRFCCKYFAEKLTEAEFFRIFCKNILQSDGLLEVRTDNEPAFEGPADEFLNALIEIIIDLPTNDLTTEIHFEAVSCMLCLFSGQLFFEKANSATKWTQLLMSGKCSINAAQLAKTLLQNYFQHSDSPVESQQLFDSGGSLVLGLAASMWNVLQWGIGAEESENAAATPNPSVGSQSLLLLLCLVCQYRKGISNPYRQALFSFTNAQEKASLTSPQAVASAFKLDYSKLYEIVCGRGKEEPTLLLVYFLMHQNVAFRNYVLSRVNIDTFVLPVIRFLYQDTSTSSAHSVYLALIIVLLLSEDDFFCKVVHETTLKEIEWYKDKNFTEISLGGLIILVLIRCIQVNIVKVRDRYLHTHCLAALANMSAHFKQLHPVVAQKLVSLLEVLSKRYARSLEHIRLSAEYDLSQFPMQTADTVQDISVLEEGIRMLLEVLNSCLSHNLHQNPHLIYTLMYKRQLFNQFSTHPSFQDIVQNIETVLNHFSARLKQLDANASVQQVLEVIQKGALQWSSDRLKKFPDLKFKYVEDDNTEDFFVPYSWTLVYKVGGLHWDATKVKLFNAMNLNQQPAQKKEHVIKDI